MTNTSMDDMTASVDSTSAPVSRTASGGFKTSEGTFYLSKPFRSRTSKKLRAMIKFTPRTSHFDTTNELSGINEFRGFFTLFWISMFLFAVRTYIKSFETNGYALSLTFAALFSKDAIGLALSDAALVASTAICVPFATAVSKGWIRYYWTGVILQHLLQTSILVIAITWTCNRDWPWVQSGFLTLHTLVMIMKMHSYIATNGHFHQISKQSEEIRQRLRHLTEAAGGWEQALANAKTHKAHLDDQARLTPSWDLTPGGTPEVLDASSTSIVDVNTASTLRQRLLAASAGIPPTSKHPTRADFTLTVTEPIQPSGMLTLVDHPDEEISTLARELSELESELTSSGPNRVQWPNNITYKNFAVYQLIPTLVYELEYPRTDRIRPIYVFEKTVATFGTFALLYTITESFILPLTPTPNQPFFHSLLDLALPFMMCYLLLFYIIFECICNGFAELSYFADRQFYEDWVWNATSWDEFSRKWNKPVHSFLLRHVYASAITSYKVSRMTAMFITFLLSAAVHELVMVVVTRKLRLYIFLMQLVQLPLIAISRLPFIKRNQLLGNVVFWIGIYAGLPLLCVAYVAY